ncbi:MAG TPA: discoidin domain-containing protein [Kofleriaceae bacterium]
MKILGVVSGMSVMLGSHVAQADRVLAVEATASSSAAGKNDKFAAWRAVDGLTETAWCEGKPDEGVDQTIKLTFAEPIKVTRLDLYVGLHGTAKEYGENNQPSKVTVQTAPKTGDAMVVLGKAIPVVSKHDMLVKLDLKTARTIQVLELSLAGVTRGTNAKVNHTCISDISLVSEKKEVVNFLYGLSAEAMTSLQASVNVLRTAMAGCEEKVLSYAVKFPLEHRIVAEEDSRTIKHKTAKALVKACAKKGFPTIPVDTDDAQLSATGLGRVSLEPSASSDVFRFDMIWTDGGWKLASLESR